MVPHWFTSGSGLAKQVVQSVSMVQVWFSLVVV